MEPEREEVEQIPWTMLAEQLEGGRRRSLASIALAVVAALVAGAIAFSVLRRPSGTVVELTPSAAVADATVAPGTQPHSTATTVPAIAGGEDSPPRPSLYSEADLRAVVSMPESTRLVAAAAEWFVADYFTVLGADDRTQTASGELPSPDPGEAGYSWAEWVRAAAIDQLDEGRHDVTVLFRTIYRDGRGALVRAPVRRAAVEVTVDADGRPSVVGLPRVEEVAALEAVAGGEVVSPPDAVAATAVAQAAALGTAAEVEGAVEGPSGWRVVVSVVDASGVRWPLMFHVVDAG